MKTASGSSTFCCKMLLIVLVYGMFFPTGVVFLTAVFVVVTVQGGVGGGVGLIRSRL